MDFEDIYFQQDGATCHTGAENIQLLQTKFTGRIVSAAIGIGHQDYATWKF